MLTQVVSKYIICNSWKGYISVFNTVLLCSEDKKYTRNNKQANWLDWWRRPQRRSSPSRCDNRPASSPCTCRQPSPPCSRSSARAPPSASPRSPRGHVLIALPLPADRLHIELQALFLVSSLVEHTGRLDKRSGKKKKTESWDKFHPILPVQSQKPPNFKVVIKW